MDDYNSLMTIGYPELSVSKTGICYDCKRERYLTLIHGLYYLEKYEGELIHITVRTPKALVLFSWSRLPEDQWYDSPFADDIREFKQNLISLPKSDKVKLPFKRKDGTGYWLTKYGRIWREIDATEIRYPRSNTGYVNLKLGEEQNIALHRLVAHYFVPIPEGYVKEGYSNHSLVVNHIDGNKRNNRWDNLEWLPQSLNIKHASLSSLMRTSISDEMLEMVWKLLEEGKSNTEISKITKIPDVTVSNIRNKVSPRYNTNKYHWKTTKEIREERNQRIIKDYNDGIRFKDIIKKHNVTETVLSKILHNYSDQITRERPNTNMERTKLTQEQLDIVFKRLMEGDVPLVQIAKEAGIDAYKVSQIKNRKIYVREGLQYEWPNDNSGMDLSVERAKLLAPTTTEVNNRKVIEAYNAGHKTTAELMKETGLNRSTIRGILIRNNLHTANGNAHDFTDDELDEIFYHLQQGKRDQWIAAKYHVDPQRIGAIRSRKNYADKSKDYVWPTSDQMKQSFFDSKEHRRSVERGFLKF